MRPQIMPFSGGDLPRFLRPSAVCRPIQRELSVPSKTDCYPRVLLSPLNASRFTFRANGFKLPTAAEMELFRSPCFLLHFQTSRSVGIYSGRTVFFNQSY